MANPNLLGIGTVTGLSTNVGIATTAHTVFLSNAASSGKLLKINNLTAINVNGSTAVNVTIKYHNQAAGAGTSTSLTYLIPVPAAASLIVIGKENPVYLEENRSLGVTAGSANGIDIYCSYDEIL